MDTLQKRPAGAPSPKLVLIADDYEGAAEIIATLVELDFPCETACVRDGQHAIDFATLREPFATLLDIDMPRLDGIEAARAIRALYPQGRMVIFAMTGGWRLREATASGLFDNVFPKPLDTDTLYSALATAWRQAMDEGAR